jgi:cell division protein FtsN
MATAAPTPLASGDTAYLYRAAIGPRGQDYYLRHFARFDGEGKAGTSWNWAAYWTTFNWLLYRRMWGWALAYVAALLGLALLIFGVGKLVLNYSDTSAILLFLGLLTLAFVVPGMYANAWFYTHSNEKISAVLRKTPDLKQAAAALAEDAPDNRRLLILALGNAAVLALGLSLANWLQSSTDSALPQLASADERLPVARGQSGLLQPTVTPTPASPAVASAPAAAASAPAVVSTPAVAASAPAAAPALATAVPETPRPTAAATPATPAPAATARPASPMIQAADRPPARPEPAVAPRPERVSPPPAAPAVVRAPAPRPAASAPRAMQYVWVVQVGAYAQEDNARKALAQVQGLGLEAGSETFGSTPLTRVRVGPFTRQAEAEQAALRIKSLDLPAQVIRQRP